MTYHINSRQNDKIKDVVKLFQLSEKKKQQKFIVEGYHLLELALKAKVVLEVYSLKELDIDNSITQYIVTPEILDKISQVKTSQGVVAICQMLPSKDITSPKVLYLDDVADPGNVGTLLRTALAFSFKDVIVTKNTCNVYNEKVIQASQGAIFSLNIINDENIINNLKDYSIIATEIKGSVNINEIEPLNKFVLILGNEAHGVNPELLKIADKRIRIDIKEIESLNVAVAGGIAMYALSK